MSPLSRPPKPARRYLSPAYDDSQARRLGMIGSCDGLWAREKKSKGGEWWGLPVRTIRQPHIALRLTQAPGINQYLLRVTAGRISPCHIRRIDYSPSKFFQKAPLISNNLSILKIRLNLKPARTKMEHGYDVPSNPLKAKVTIKAKTTNAT